MRHFAFAFLLLLPVLRAQDVPPPPRPADIPPPAGPANGEPSLDVTMKFIQDKLGSLGKVSFAEPSHNTKTGQDSSTNYDMEIGKVTADRQQCRLSFHWKESKNGVVAQDADLWFPLRDVRDVTLEPYEHLLDDLSAKAGHPENTAGLGNPPVTILLVNRSGTFNMFPFVEAELADRVARAINHAVELCAGGGRGVLR
jgi:hypothetical protein